MTNKTMTKVNFADYEGKYDEEILNKMESVPDSVDVESVRTALYGFTFTDEYKNGEIDDRLSMDYWKDKYFDDLWGDDEDENEDEDMDLPDFTLDDDDYIVDTPQERLLLQAIDSTGDGKTPETALCVIDVHQEYEYINRVSPYSMLKRKRQSLLKGYIDCIEFEDPLLGTKCLYFDISRRYEKQPYV